MSDALVLAVPAIHELAAADEIHCAQLAGKRFISLPTHEGSVLADRLRLLAHAQRFVPRVGQVAWSTSRRAGPSAS